MNIEHTDANAHTDSAYGPEGFRWHRCPCCSDDWFTDCATYERVWKALDDEGSEQAVSPDD